MGNREVNYLDILPQEQLPTHLSLPCYLRVKIDVNVNNNTTRNEINSWKVIQASSAHLTNIFEMVSHTVVNILMVRESKIQTSLLANFQIAAKTHWQNAVQLFRVFYIMIQERMHERHFATESVTWLDVVTLNVV